MAAGRPAVVVDSGGPAETAIDGVTGFGASTHRGEAFADAPIKIDSRSPRRPAAHLPCGSQIASVLRAFSRHASGTRLESISSSGKSGIGNGMTGWLGDKSATQDTDNDFHDAASMRRDVARGDALAMGGADSYFAGRPGLSRLAACDGQLPRADWHYRRLGADYSDTGSGKIVRAWPLVPDAARTQWLRRTGLIAFYYLVKKLPGHKRPIIRGSEIAGESTATLKSIHVQALTLSSHLSAHISRTYADSISNTNFSRRDGTQSCDGIRRRGCLRIALRHCVRLPPLAWLSMLK